MKKQIAIGNDHAGTTLKFKLLEALQGDEYEFLNIGTDDNASVDYPDYIHPLAKTVETNRVDFGVAICGSAQGVSITANRHPKVRAAVCWNKEIAELARQHNNANVLCLPARFLSEDEAPEIVRVFLNTAFEGGRHQRRVEKIEL